MVFIDLIESHALALVLTSYPINDKMTKILNRIHNPKPSNKKQYPKPKTKSHSSHNQSQSLNHFNFDLTTLINPQTTIPIKNLEIQITNHTENEYNETLFQS